VFVVVVIMLYWRPKYVADLPTNRDKVLKAIVVLDGLSFDKFISNTTGQTT
jgi:hypothetical protein